MQQTRVDAWGVARTLPAVEWALLLAALALVATAHTCSGWTLAAVGALAAFVTLRTWRGVMWPHRTGLEAPIGLFVLSAGVAVWVAYDPFLALLQFSRLLAGVVLFLSLPGSSTTEQRWLAAGLVLAAAVLAVCWPLQHDFAVDPAKFAWGQSVGLWATAHLPRLVLTRLTGVPIHRNVAAGTLALALPFALGLAWDGRRARRPTRTVLAMLGALAILVGLLLTSSRGAWLGLAASAFLGVMILARRCGLTGLQGHAYVRGAMVVAILTVVGGVVAGGDTSGALMRLTDSCETVRSRVTLWQQGLGLVRDYPYTGSGLMSFRMVHSTYALLLHTPFVAHVHNTFLEVCIEQGILGALALVWGTWVIIGWTRRALHRSGAPPLGWAGLAALTTVAVHNTVDVVFYVERTLPLLGLALGYSWLAVGPQPAAARRTANGPLNEGDSPFSRFGIAAEFSLQRGTVPLFQRTAKTRTCVGLGVLLFLAAGAFFHRPLLGAWHANLGAIEQTRQELGRYDPSAFNEVSLDQVRRSAPLGDAEASFHRALAWQPGNRTALQRLAEISLSRGDYSRALNLTQTAWDLGYRDDASRLLHGDALVADGQVDAAVETVRGLTWAVRRLAVQGWYRYWSAPDYRRAAYAWQAALLLDPANQQLQDLLRQAHERLGP